MATASQCPSTLQSLLSCRLLVLAESMADLKQNKNMIRWGKLWEHNTCFDRHKKAGEYP